MFKARASVFCGHAALSAIRLTGGYCVSVANARWNAPSTILADDGAAAASLRGPSWRRLVKKQDAIRPAAQLIELEIAALAGGWLLSQDIDATNKKRLYGQLTPEMRTASAPREMGQGRSDVGRYPINAPPRHCHDLAGPKLTDRCYAEPRGKAPLVRPARGVRGCRVEARPERGCGRNDSDHYTDRQKAIFDRARAALIRHKFRKQIAYIRNEATFTHDDSLTS